MHDPDTVAFEIRLPLLTRTRFGRNYLSLVTIWHHDPERDGSDNSCGWSYVKLTKEDRELAASLQSWEESFPFFFAQPQRIDNPEYPTAWSIGPGDAAAVLVELFEQIAWRLERRRLTATEAQYAARLGHNQVDHFRHSLTASDREEQRRALLMIIRAYRTMRRPWWRHPRWHVHHWRLQIHPLQSFKRWAFTRCKVCGERFRWGETGLGTWSSDGPRWFRSEDLTHMRCCGMAVYTATADAEASHP